MKEVETQRNKLATQLSDKEEEKEMILEDMAKLARYCADMQEERQELIKMLEEANKRDAESVKRYEEMRRNYQDNFYKQSYQTSIHKLNARREVRRNILSKLKEEV